MRIAIDFDDTIVDTTKKVREYLNRYNLEEFEDIEEKTKFYIKHIDDITKDLELKPYAKEVLNELSKNDKISIYDLSGNKVDYVIYDIYEAKSDDTPCTFQNTNGLRIVTLVTCNNVNGKRLVIHAKEMEKIKSN